MQLTKDRAAFVGQSLERVEDAALLSGRGAYMDDLGVNPGTLHAAILRSPHAHADIVSIKTEPARALPGVFAVMSGADLAAISAPLISGVRAPIEARAIAVERVRYVGEPVAIAVASDRYRAEDALDAIEVEYRQRPAVVDPQAALDADASILHEAVGSNLVSDRTFVYGDPDAAFAAAARRVSVTARYPRNTGSPIETYGVVAHYDPHEDAYEILANFQGPFSLHAVIARARSRYQETGCACACRRIRAAASASSRELRPMRFSLRRRHAWLDGLSNGSRIAWSILPPRCRRRTASAP